jgi:hypothetical protein
MEDGTAVRRHGGRFFYAGRDGKDGKTEEEEDREV